MTIKVVCRGCSRELDVPESFAGKQGKCPYCYTVLNIPQPEAEQRQNDKVYKAIPGSKENANLHEGPFEAGAASILPSADEQRHDDEKRREIGKSKNIARVERGPIEKGCFVALPILILIIAAFFVVRYQISRPQRIIARQYSETNALFPFLPDQQGHLTPEQIQRYLAVRREIVPYLQKVVCVIEEARTEKSNEGGGAGLAFRTGKKLLPALNELGSTHADALRRHRMSQNEYCWIGRRAFAVLQQAAASGSERSIEWRSVQMAYQKGAPRTLKYRRDPPELSKRLHLANMDTDADDVACIRNNREALFYPEEVLYQEVELLAGHQDE